MIGSVTLKLSPNDAKLVADALKTLADETTREKKSTDLVSFLNTHGRVDSKEALIRLTGAFKTAWLSCHVTRS